MKKSPWAEWEDRYGKRVHMGLFDYTIIVVFHPDILRATEYAKWKLDLPEKYSRLDDLCLGRTFWREGYTPIIWLPKKPKTAREWGTLAHESVHAMMQMYDWAGINVNLETEEIMAHGVSKIMTTAMR